MATPKTLTPAGTPVPGLLNAEFFPGAGFDGAPLARVATAWGGSTYFTPAREALHTVGAGLDRLTDRLLGKQVKSTS